MDNRFRPIINIGRGATEKNIPFVVYLHKFRMAAIGHLGFLIFDILALESNLNTRILLEWFILRFKVIWKSKTRWLPIIALNMIFFLQITL